MEKDKSAIYSRLLKSRVFFLFLLPIFFALVFGVAQKFYDRYQLTGEMDELGGQLENLNRQKSELNDLLRYYQSQSNLEKEARLRLNLKKEGEQVVIILPPATSTEENKAVISEAFSGGAELPNYKQWLYYFFGR